MKLTDSQKKIAGVAIIIIFGTTGESAPEQAFSFVFVMGIFAVPLRWGIRL